MPVTANSDLLEPQFLETVVGNTHCMSREFCGWVRSGGQEDCAGNSTITCNLNMSNSRQLSLPVRWKS